MLFKHRQIINVMEIETSAGKDYNLREKPLTSSQIPFHQKERKNGIGRAKMSALKLSSGGFILIISRIP